MVPIWPNPPGMGALPNALPLGLPVCLSEDLYDVILRAGARLNIPLQGTAERIAATNFNLADVPDVASAWVEDMVQRIVVFGDRLAQVVSLSEQVVVKVRVSVHVSVHMWSAGGLSVRLRLPVREERAPGQRLRCLAVVGLFSFVRGNARPLRAVIILTACFVCLARQNRGNLHSCGSMPSPMARKSCWTALLGPRGDAAQPAGTSWLLICR
jgi:hypothetical protein